MPEMNNNQTTSDKCVNSDTPNSKYKGNKQIRGPNKKRVTVKQLQAMRLVSLGMTQAEIARSLNISDNAVKERLKNLDKVMVANGITDPHKTAVQTIDQELPSAADLYVRRLKKEKSDKDVDRAIGIARDMLFGRGVLIRRNVETKAEARLTLDMKANATKEDIAAICAFLPGVAQALPADVISIKDTPDPPLPAGVRHEQADVDE